MNHPRHHSSQGAARLERCFVHVVVPNVPRVRVKPDGSAFLSAMLRGIFTKFGPSNPVKAPSDAANSKPAAFIPCRRAQK
jgi:hypothetical protein